MSKFPWLLLWATLIGKAAPATAASSPKKQDAATTSSSTTSELSAELRRDKHFEVSGEVGSALSPAFTAGVRFGIHLSPESLVEFSATSGSYENDDSVFTDKKDKFEAFTTDARYKRFWNNSFYTALGGGIRSMDQKLYFNSYEFSGINKATNYEGKATSAVFDFAIGNAWQFDSFLIGTDWVGVMIPVVKLSSTETFSDDHIKDLSNDRISKFRKDRQTLSAQALRLYCGAAF